MRLITLLSFPLLLCFASATNAVDSIEGSTGQVLLFPFYTVENGLDSSVNVFPENGTALVLRVRFLEGIGGEVINSFNVYLDKHVAFRAGLTANDQGEAVLTIAEGTCVLDDELTTGGPGSEFVLDASTGMIEVYELAISEVGSDYSCEGAAQRWQADGVWLTNPAKDARAPSFSDGLIAGEAYLVNVPEGLAVTYQATALQNVFENPVHTAPDDASPNLAEADPVVTLSDGSEVVPDSGEGIDAIGMVISRDHRFLSNEVVVAQDIGARTDWVISYPLQAYRNDKPYTADVDGAILYCGEFGNIAEDGAPSVITQLGGPFASGGGKRFTSSRYNVIQASPLPPSVVALQMCNAVNTVSFGGKPPILQNGSSELRTPATNGLSETFAGIDTYSLRWFFDGPATMLGFRVTTFQNGSLDGGATLANYAVLQQHRKH